MTRRNLTQIRLSTLVRVFGGFLAISLAVFFLVFRTGDAFGKLEKLDAAAYVDSAKSFQGGVYLLEGTIDELLGASSPHGRLVSVAVSSSRGVVLIPVLVPQNLGSFNLQKGQVCKFKVQGFERGLLKAEKIGKAL